MKNVISAPVVVLLRIKMIDKYSRLEMDMDKEKVLNELDALLAEGEIVLASRRSFEVWEYVDKSLNIAWLNKIVSFLNMFLESDNNNILAIKRMKQNYYEEAVTCVGILKNIKDYVEKGFINLNESGKVEADVALNIIFNRFHKVARQLRSRHAGKNTIEIEDEYDVQDLLHSLLHLYFDDIRPEEHTPSYAGSSARVDFLLKSEKIVIEVKKTRKGLADKEVGNQLIEDIERYRVHPDCEKLVCFVYDPEGRIGNPIGLINDLQNKHEGFVEIFIKPDM